VSYVELQNLTWPEAERLGAEGAVGLIPLASLEQHGPQLPLATDSLLAERVALDVANRLPGPVVVTPVLRGGLSTHHLAFPGSVTLPPGAYSEVVIASIEGLERMGIDKIALFSAHGGNFTFLAELVAAYDGPAKVAGYSDLGGFLEVMTAAAAAVGLVVPETDVHAGGLETSMMLAAYPDLVRPFDGVEGYTAAEPGWLEQMFEHGIKPISETGVLGELRDANAAAGEALLAAIAEELAGYFTRQLDLKL
jgi:creatinine amidohydrolase